MPLAQLVQQPAAAAAPLAKRPPRRHRAPQQQDVCSLLVRVLLRLSRGEQLTLETVKAAWRELSFSFVFEVRRRNASRARQAAACCPQPTQPSRPLCRRPTSPAPRSTSTCSCCMLRRWTGCWRPSRPPPWPTLCSLCAGSTSRRPLRRRLRSRHARRRSSAARPSCARRCCGTWLLQGRAAAMRRGKRPPSRQRLCRRWGPQHLTTARLLLQRRQEQMPGWRLRAQAWQLLARTCCPALPELRCPLPSRPTQQHCWALRQLTSRRFSQQRPSHQPQLRRHRRTLALTMCWSRWSRRRQYRWWWPGARQHAARRPAPCPRCPSLSPVCLRAQRQGLHSLLQRGWTWRA